MSINIGISEKDRHTIADGLSVLLADSYTLYLKTQNFHWNVTGLMFQSLHAMFEQQYTDLATVIDTIAERIRALGFPAPASYSQYTKLAHIKEETSVLKAEMMVQQLMQDHETIVKTSRPLLEIAANAKDEGTVALLSERIEIHEKTAWMLRSVLD